MWVDIVHADGDVDPTVAGHWKNRQDPDSGEVTRIWVPDESSTSDVDYVYDQHIPCLARGYVGTGLQGGGSGETFGAIYQSVDTIRLWYPANVLLTKRDKVTNVSGPDGIIWKEEELVSDTATAKATVFEVMGIVPLLDMYGKHIENYALCERAEVQ